MAKKRGKSILEKTEKQPGKKRASGEDLPLEYAKGFTGFLGCRIFLSRRVLIPRPETEFWTAAAIGDLKKTKKGRLEVLDIFSGSGCVGIAVLRKVKESRVDFAEIDPGAIRQIRINLKRNGIGSERYRVVRSDMFKNLPAGVKYDAILANPPYVDPGRIKEIQPSVLSYEPHLALFGGKRGMAKIKKFLRQAKKHLKENGSAYMEFDPGQESEIRELLEKNGYCFFNFLRDQFGRMRWVRIDMKKRNTDNIISGHCR